MADLRSCAQRPRAASGPEQLGGRRRAERALDFGEGVASFRAALAGLADLEEDLHRHVHIEKNILFPRPLEQAG